MTGLKFPYTYIACPCSDTTRRKAGASRNSRDVSLDGDEEEETAFDSRNPRSAFSLFPPEHLFYCEECQDINCPRCVIEEIICWYCPHCLFETPSSMVRSEGNRCARNCFSCPICTSQMITSSIGDAKEGPWILNCNYCMWATLDIGIKFDKPTNIRSQLDRISNGGKTKPLSNLSNTPEVSRKSSVAHEASSTTNSNEETNTPPPDQPDMSDPQTRFNALKTFYRDQIALSSGDPALPASIADLAYSSPSSLARIMSLYSNSSSAAFKKLRQKPSVMREALTEVEGLRVREHDQISDLISQIQMCDLNDTTSTTQRHFQQGAGGGTPSARFASDLRPMPALLRTKRSKRCATCKHILVKPEFKPTSTRYRMRLLAMNYIPLVSLQPVPVDGGHRPIGVDGADVVLQPDQPTQWILRLKNHLFDRIKVSLGTPSTTPGKWGHKVTILCPQFEIGPNSDVWDEALNSNTGPQSTRAAKLGGDTGGGVGEQIAGKLYDSGRNWASVVIEIVPARISSAGAVAAVSGPDSDDDSEKEEVQEDEDVVEIPIRVRLEWRQSEIGGGGVAAVGRTEGAAAKEKLKDIDKDKDKDGKKGPPPSDRSAAANEKVHDDDDAAIAGSRELAYWMVLGVGRVATL